MHSINVTKTFLPPLDQYTTYLEGIWERVWLTNNGVLLLELEEKLKEYLGVKHLFFVNNGTIALQIAIKALDLKGEILTTPFSYVATTSSIVWENCTPIFVDIDPHTLCLDPNLIEESINPNTVAIMATHVYGNACNILRIKEIALKHNLKVIYDAAHAFGTLYKGKSILNFGDISTLSFHATKLFHTGEGGAIVCDDDELAHKISYLRNFGHNGPEAFWGLGINGKSSELHAAMGLCVLPRVPELIRKRKAITEEYDKHLRDSQIRRPAVEAFAEVNFAYYPVILPSEDVLLKVVQALNKENVFPRRYFYPSLNKLNYIEYLKMEVSEDISTRVLCLPIYYDLDIEDVKRISQIVLNSLAL